VFNDGGNHQTLADCVDALKREVETLRATLAERERLKEAAADPQPTSGRRPWKFRNG
jgi:hypothetical protein